MPSEIIQAEYDTLETVAKMMGEQSDVITSLRNNLQTLTGNLRDGGWEGRGSDAFLSEMQDQVLPALVRLSDAFDAGSEATMQVMTTLQSAEEEAANTWQIDYTPAQATSAPAESGGGGWLEWVHGGLDIVGLVPGVGEIADGINGVIYTIEGRKLEAGLSFGAMIPIAGWGATAGKVGVRATRELGEEGAERVLREGAEAGSERIVRNIPADPPIQRSVASGHRSVRDPNFLKFGELPPSSTLTRNGYTYATDAQGRITRAGGELRLEDFPRYRSYETQIGRLGEAADEGGHLIANRFGGVSEGVNLVPQNGNLNVGAWKAMENSWARALDAGQSVQVDILTRYAGDSTRPDRFVVSYTIDGETFERIFRNRPGG